MTDSHNGGTLPLSELDMMQGLLERLACAFNSGADGTEAVGREIISLGNKLRLHPHEQAGEVIANWLDERNHRLPMN